MNGKRVYRREARGRRLTSFNIAVKETDLWIAVSGGSYHDSLPAQVEKLILNERLRLERYLKLHPHLALSLKPCLTDQDAPPILKTMAGAANRAGVGPMAAVAGALAEAAGLFLLSHSPEVIVENGGDIFIKVIDPVTVGIYAGHSPLSGRLALLIDPDRTPLGVCTSSGTVGPSLSFGKADAAVVLSPSTPLADAVATALCNRVRESSDFEKALDFAKTIEGISGALLICGDKVAAWGDIKLQEA